MLRLGFAVFVLTIALVPGSAGAQEEVEAVEEPQVWSGSADFSLVRTSGNAEAETLGLRTLWAREGQASTVTLEAAGLRAESTTTERFGVGTPDDFREVEISNSEVTAQNYMARARYDRLVSERLFWFLGVGWDRNTFAGIDARYVGSVGAGHHWFKSDTGHFTTTYGLTYTSREEVIGTTDSFAGVRLGYDYGRQFTPTTLFGSVLIADTNFDEASDYRADFTNWVAVTMTERLALKVSVQVLYANLPALAALTLFDEAGEPTGETAFAPLDELDLLATVALVVNF